MVRKKKDNKTNQRSFYFEDYNYHSNGEFKKRVMLPLSLSYDHRIIDGAEAARFCNELKENLGANFAYKLAL